MFDVAGEICTFVESNKNIFIWESYCCQFYCVCVHLCFMHKKQVKHIHRLC